MNETHPYRGEEFKSGDQLDFAHLHEQKGVLIEPWVLEYKRAQAAAQSRETMVVPEKKLTKEQEAAQEIGGLSRKLVVVYRSEEMQPQNMLQETNNQPSPWLENAA